MSDFCKLTEVHDKAIVYIAPDFSPSKECPWNVVIIDVLDRSAKKCNKCHLETSAPETASCEIYWLATR